MTEKISFAIGIPTINRWDLLKKFLDDYLIDFPLTDIYLLDNGRQGIDTNDINLHITQPTVPLSVASSWNFLAECIFKRHTHAIILNDDIYLGKDYLQISDFLELHNNHHGFFCSQYDYSVFILPVNTWRTVGRFDQRFKGAYWEDTDYNRRLKLAKVDVCRHAFLNPSIYNQSSSIQKDPSLNLNFDENRDYYQAKWGGNKGAETFLTPFNK